jgi:pantoate--beta-alanine ligase
MPLTVVSTVEEVRHAVGEARRHGQQVGLVPTMGALHAGHTSLIDVARQETDFVVVWLFVNPAQFGPHEDLDCYPRTWEHDKEVCARHGVDLLFAPQAATVYPPGFRTFVEVEGLQDVLEGAFRPGHFRGVATVVLKLLLMVQPDLAYFGQKDAQQVAVIARMVEDLNVPVHLRICPTVREPDGLALSSRNAYLDPGQRQQATALYEALCEAQGCIEAGECSGEVVRKAMEARITSTPGAELDYAAVVDAHTFEPLARIHGTVLLALAVRFGPTRLIDNLKIIVDRGP